MGRPTAKKLTVIDLGKISDDLLDTIARMLKSGELKHAPPDYWAAQKELDGRRKNQRRRRARQLQKR